MASLKNTLNQVMQQNSSLKSKLQQINLISQVDDLPQIPSIGITDTMIRGFGNPSLSYRYKKICYPKNARASNCASLWHNQSFSMILPQLKK